MSGYIEGRVERSGTGILLYALRLNFLTYSTLDE